MAYRPIDFQVSMSNMPDKSIAHSHSLNKPVADHTFAADNFTKQTDQARIRNAAAEKAEKGSIRSGEERQRQGDARQRGKRQSEAEDGAELHSKQSDLHPYKGKNFDVSL
ncbi:hypothetical protein PCCS19_38060 [Paenibacillus sp. CCS19]|uniref:hypothetical protein n=1 Tax=Paenibacillus sp. CCS19 TaxID=3158387 RepID=UPI00256A48F2|nr:hypothetical protein [Paenibacillus cellulosilyticus]GMK40750.1 hypothetical protein PCCS19_38060 [Paenibacillus cellulosilyticus]